MSYARILLLFLLIGLVSACKIEVVVPEGGRVESQSGTYICQSGSTCVIDVSDVFFDEVFEAVPEPGYSFAAWKKRDFAFCPEGIGNCALATTLFTGTALIPVLESDRVFYLEPVFETTGLDMMTSQDQSRLQDITSAYTGGQSTCNKLRKFSGNNTDASTALSSCIDNASNFSILNLPPGSYRIDNPIDIAKPIYIRTLKKKIKDEACSHVDNASCAELVAGPNLMPPSRGGILNVNSANVTLGHLVVTGSKVSRRNSEAGQICATIDNSFGFNISVFAPNFTFYSSVTQDSLCATGLAFNPSGKVIILNSVAADNGVSDRPGMWADGFTINDAHSSIVSRNKIINSTDIDLIFGGCQNCRIQGNVIEHTDDFASSSFAGLMLHAWPHTTGDYTGTITSKNKIRCENKRCGYGLYLGSLSWYVAPMFGGIVKDNTIDNAMLGFNVERSTGSVEISNNRVSNSGGFHNTSCGAREMGSYNISADSVVDRANDDIPDNRYTHVSYAGCIPNFFDTNPSIKKSCDPETQPSPTWGQRDGYCLLSCGALGGTVASASECSNQGLMDVGRSYDVDFCCN